ncbi:glycoprotein [Streptococcus salivarius]|uniref:Glycoprotein n=1 Tax=Streptococcus salivarius TaxID=1304 RepID=A0AAX2V0D5_STRSL|nr:DUF6246 family protein [Streptococcus salivarius]TNF65768.1 glycoprotein [Streptococcus salivarius]
MRAISSASTFFRRKPKPPRATGSSVPIHTSVGEVGIHLNNGRDIVLRPSLFAMSQLGEPDEIVALVANVWGDPVTPNDARLQMMNAIAVLAACTTEDIRSLTGYHDGAILVPGPMAPGAILLIARRLLRHGVTGALPEPEHVPGTPEPEYSTTFDARSYVAMGMAHLGLTESEAWAMTMTGLSGAMRSKYPPPKPDEKPRKGPSQKELEKVLDWHDKITAMRNG